MQIFVVTNVVDGRVMQVEARHTFLEALEVANQLAAEQCNTSESEIRAELERDHSFAAKQGDILISIDDCELPEEV